MGVKLHVDLETLQLVQGPGLRSAVNSLRFKRGDAARIQVIFLESGISPVPIGDPDALEIQIGIKPRNQFDHSYLAHSAVWSMPAEGDDTPTYECELSLNTLQLNSALNVGSATAEELPEITLMGEITWREGNGEPTSTRTFLVVVENDVNRGTEGAPSDANPGNITLTGTIAASNLSGTNTGDQDLSGLAPIVHTHGVADITSVASQRLIGRHAGGSGAAQEIQASGGIEFSGGAIQRSALTGDVTASAGSNATTIANDTVSNAKLANMATATIKGRNAPGTGDPEDLTATQARTVLGLGTAATRSIGTIENTIPLLGAGGKLASSLLPSIAITETLSVANAAARLALTSAQAQGKIVVEADTGRSFGLITGGNPATFANWLQVGDRDITAADITDSTAAGRSLLTAADVAAQITALGTDALYVGLTGDQTVAGTKTFQQIKIPGPYTDDIEAAVAGVLDDRLYFQPAGSVVANVDHLSLDLQFAADKTLTARKGPTPTFTRASTATYFAPSQINAVYTFDGTNFNVNVVQSTLLNGRYRWQDGDTGLYYTGTAWSLSHDGNAVVTSAPTSNAWRPDLADWSGTGAVITATSTFGIVRSASGEPRFDHDTTAPKACRGLLIEESRTNLVFPSAPLATQTRTVTAATHTLSFYGTGTIALTGAHVATVTGTGAFPTRTTLTFTPTAGSLILTVTGTVQFAQLEAAAFASSYIPTTTGSLVRSADICSIAEEDFTSFYNEFAGTVLSESTLNGVSLFNTPNTASFGGQQNGISMLERTGAQSLQGLIISDESSYFNSNIGNITAGVARKSAMAFQNDGSAILCLDGTLGTQDDSITLPSDSTNGQTPSTLILFRGQFTTVKSFRYYKKRLANAKLQSLTT